MRPGPGPARAFGRLARASPVRLAVALIALFPAVSLVTLGAAYLRIRGDLTDRIDASLDQHVAAFRVAGDPATLAALVAAEAAATDPERRVIVYIAPDGTAAGHARAELRGAGDRLGRAAEGRKLATEGYATRVAPMAGGTLVVGESLEPIDDLAETFLDLVALSLVPTILISLAAGVWLAAAAARRVGRIEAALNRLARGDLTARVDEPDRDDDLGRIGAGIDRMAEAQEAATAAPRQVSADIAHDLRTPVRRLALLLADLRDRPPEDGPEAGLAARAAEEAAQAAAVFQPLLQIAQIEGGGPRARFAPVDLAAVLRTVAEVYEPAAEVTGHALRLAPPAAAPVLVTGDRTLLGQAVANLIENALRHTPPGSRIDIALERQPGRALLTAADDGPGRPETERERVRRRLYRLERSRTTPGHGLGLSPVEAIAEAHGAALTLDDDAPGLRATLAFPRAG